MQKISFHLRRNLLVTGFIIMLVGIIWLFISLSSLLFISLSSLLFIADEEKLVTKNETINYIEKIDKFVLQGFNERQQLAHFIEAEKYYNFKQEPALLLDPKVIIYDAKGKEIYTLTAKRANYLENGEIKFKGKVDIDSKSGVGYQVNTKELSVNTNTNNLTSNKKIIYLDNKAKVIAQGMSMKPSEEKMRLIGKTTINQDGGQKILTRDLLIDQSKSKKHYYSKHNTTYLASGNKIYSQGLDMDIQKGLATLIGKVKVLQKSGTKIDTRKLIVDQSKGREIYRTKEKVHYKSGILDIHAKGMYYDVKAKKVRLTGGVVGRYE